MTLHDFFWFGLFPANCFAMGLCVGRYFTEWGWIPVWPRKKPSEVRSTDGGSNGT